MTINWPSLDEVIANPSKYGSFFTRFADRLAGLVRQGRRAEAESDYNLQKSYIYNDIQKANETVYGIMNNGAAADPSHPQYKGAKAQLDYLRKGLVSIFSSSIVSDPIPTLEEIIGKPMKDPQGTQVVDAKGNIISAPTQPLRQTDTDAVNSLQPTNIVSSNLGSGLTLQGLLSDPRIQNDTRMTQWVQGNASLIPKLSSLGYSVTDIVNEAYSWTRKNQSAFPKDMTTTDRAANTSYITNPITQNNPSDTSSDPDPKGSLVKFANSPTVYFVDKEAKTLVPFVSAGAFESYYGENAQEAWDSIEEIEPIDSRISGYVYSKEMVAQDGTMPKIDTSVANIQNRYGKTNSEESNYKAYQTLNGFLNLLKGNATDAGLDVMTLDSILNDSNAIGKYMNALAYGGYTLEDVFKDVKQKQLVKNGDSSLANISVISDSQTRETYANSDAGKSALSNTSLAIPSTIKGLTNTDLLSLNIFQMPDTLFKELVPLLDITSDEFKTAAEEIKTAYYDVLEQQINANTEQSKALADENYNILKENVERTYGIKLENSALDAWDQIQSLDASLSSKGLAGSGIGNETLDKFLRSVRRSDQQTRQTKLDQKSMNEANFYTASASPEQIKALNAEDQAKGLSQDQWRTTKWGLTPSSDVASKLDVNYLMNTYGITQKEAENYRASIIDPNGNYYSTLYGNKMKSLYGNAATGQTGLYQAKKETQQNLLEQKTSEAERQAYYDVTTDPSNTYSNNRPAGAVTDNEYKKAQEISSKINTGTNVNTQNSYTAPAVPAPSAPAVSTQSASGSPDDLVSVKLSDGRIKKMYRSAYEGSYKSQGATLV